MGVDRTDYLMFGVKLEYDLFDWEKHIEELEGGPQKRFDLVADMMSGKYLVAGKIIASSDGYEGLEFTEITKDMLENDVTSLAEKVSDALGVEVPPSDFKMLLFSHYS